MAELAAVGAAASIGQFVLIAGKVVKRINSYCRTVHDSPEVFRRLTIDLPLLIEVCDKYKALPHGSHSKAVKDALAECLQHVCKLEKYLLKATPADGDSNPTKLKKAFKSFGLEDKVEDSMSRLKNLKDTLHLDISLTTLAVMKPPAASDTEKKCICVPSGRLSKFFGRTKLLGLIDRSLKPGGRDPKVCVLQGMGGQGKTCLALEYCKREIASGYFKTILWVEAKSLGSVHRSFAHFAETLTDNQRHFADSKACVHQVKDILQTWATPWLVVYDNYDRLSDIPGVLDYLPSSDRGAVLVTSRHPGCESLGHVIRIDGMEPEESMHFFLDRIGLERSHENMQAADEVVTALEYLPLAIDQSAAYIKARKMSPRTFLTHYEKRRLKVMTFIPEMTTYKGLDRGSVGEEEKPLSVFTTWEMSRDQIWHSNNITKDEANHVAHFLTTLSFFSNSYLRMDMFRVYFETSHEKPPWISIFENFETLEWDDCAYQDVIAILEQLWLIRYQEQHSHDDTTHDRHHMVSIHPLVQSWIQLRLNQQARRMHCIEALNILHQYILSTGRHETPMSLKQRRVLLSHLDSTLDWQSRYVKGWELDESYDLRKACEDFMRYYIAEGKYNEAQSICEALLKADMSGNSDVAKGVWARADLAGIYIHQGRYLDAEHVLLRARVSNGDFNLNPATGIHWAKTLGTCYFKQGRYKEAEASYRNALQLEQSTATSAKTDVSDTNELLAQVCRDLGRHEEAINLYQSALETYEDRSAHLRHLECKVHLANTYRALARNEEAATLYHDAHKGLLERLDHDHPLVIMTKLYNGINCIALEDYAFAGRSLEQVVKLASRVLGIHHPVTLKAMMNQAKAFQYEGKFAEAEALYRITLDGREQTLGLLNPYTLRTCEDLVSLLWTQGLLAEAEAMAKRVLQDRSRCNSAEDSVDLQQRLRAVSLDSAISLEDMRRPFAATELLFTSGVERCRTTLDVAHRDRIDLQEALVRVYIEQGRHVEASALSIQIKDHDAHAGAQI